ncbi:MAG: hypothetical protein EP335_10585 [Alphaproteobacteria bacterium]|nr:MAG: hypothetical protein EP335_10585 [Alphaproteobacteria bacterium]
MIRQLAICAVSAALFTQGVTAADVCMRPDELAADQTRFVETQLRVAAQQCQSGKNIDLPDLYLSFVLEKRPYLAQAEEPLNNYLERKGDAGLKSYLAGMADRVSLESARVTGFCTKSRLAAEVAVKSADPAKLLSLLPVTYERPAILCGNS